MAKIITSLSNSLGAIHNNLEGLNEGNFIHLTQIEKDKFDNIENGAEVNVNADWNSISGDSEILNKPTEFVPTSHTHNISDISGTKLEFNTSLIDGNFLFDGDIIPFDPLDYDLDDFTNVSADPFARTSELTSGITNLSYTPSTANGIVNSDTGTDATIPTVDFTNAGLLTPKEKQLLYNNSSTGITKFEGFSINIDTAKYNTGIIEGWFVDNTTNPNAPTKVFKSFPATTGNTLPNIATQNVTYVAVDINGIHQQSGIPFESELQRDWIPLGVIVHSNRTSINAINNQPVVLISPLNQLSDLMESIGFFNISGNVFTPNGVNLSINKSSGHVFKQGSNFINDNKDPHTLALTSLIAPSNLRYRTQIGTEFANTNVIDTGFYDLAGVRTAIPGTRWSIQRIYLFQSNLVRIQYGQATYTTQAEAIQAITAEAFVVEQNILENGLFRGLLIVREGATDLTDTSRALFIEASKFGSVAGLGSLSTTNLQQAYDNSITPEITTDSTLGAFTLKRGSALDTDNIFEGQNGAGVNTSSITGNGALTALTYNGFNPTTDLRNINTTSPLLGGGNLTADRTLSIQQATTSQSGFLSSTDWNTFNSKQTALGYTPENVANKQNSLAVDGTGIKYPTVDAINKKNYFVTPEDFGAVGDGVTNDIVAIQTAINSGKPVRLSAKIYFIASPIQMPFRSSISGLGELSRIKTTGNYNAFEITGGDCSIFSIGILGSGSGASNSGIYLDGLYPASSTKTNVYLHNLYINGFGNAGILFKNALNINYAPTCFASEITISGCQVGIDMQERAEYSSFSNCVLNQNSVGLKLSGGNNSFVGGQITKNGIGIHVVAGDNNGHTNMTGTAVNHNLTNSFKIENITNGYLVDGCMIYDGNILITGSNLVKFSNCDISIATFNTHTSNIELFDNKFISNPAFNFNLSSLGLSTVRFFNNTFVSGTIPAIAVSELKGNFSTTGSSTSTSFIKSGGTNSQFLKADGSIDSVSYFPLSGGNLSGSINITNLSVQGYYQARLSDTMGNGVFGGNSFSIRNGLTSEDLNFDVFNRTSSTWTTPLSILNGGSIKMNSLSGIGIRTVVADASGNLSAVASVDSRPYKVYTALLTQSGTSVPVATVLENTLGGTVVWTRTSNGIYVGTLAGVFTVNKTFTTNTFGSFSGFAQFSSSSVNTVNINTTNSSGTLTDGLLNGNSIEIRVYN